MLCVCVHLNNALDEKALNLEYSKVEICKSKRRELKKGGCSLK